MAKIGCAHLAMSKALSAAFVRREALVFEWR
jgi:hypothetical protein